MGQHLGTVKLGDSLTFYAQTSTTSTSAETDADAAPSYRIYEDETATPLLTGSMALLDDANTVGLYSEQIAVTVGNGFEVGKNYCIRIRGVVATVAGADLQTFMVDSSRVSDVKTDTAAILADTGTDGVVLAGTLATLDALWAKIKSAFRLGFRKDAAPVTDDAVVLAEINADGGSGAGAFANTTDALEALRDNYTAPDNTNIGLIKTQTDKLAFTGTDVKATLDGEKVTVTSNEDKTGYGLSAAERTTLAGVIGAYLTTLTAYLNAIAGKVWTWATRGLTEPTPAGSTSGATEDTIYQTSYFSKNIPIDLTAYTKVYYGIKRRQEDDDSEALLMIESGVGLITLNGQPATGRATWAGLTIGAGAMDVEIKDDATALLPYVRGGYRGIKAIDAGGQAHVIEETTARILPVTVKKTS